MSLFKSPHGGIHVKYYKELTCNLPIITAPEPEKVVIPLQQHTGIPCESLVKVSDKVKVGEKIGEAQGFITAPIHSSVSGTVKSITDLINPNGVKCRAITIENDGNYETGYQKPNKDYTEMSTEEILSLIKEGGVVGLGGAGFPTHAKLNARDKKIDEIIVNCAECEPYLTSDQVAIDSYPEKVIIGLKIAMKVMNASKGYFGIEDNKPKTIKILQDNIKNEDNLKVKVLKTEYPQGDAKRMIYSITNKVVPHGVRSAERGVQVINSSTAIAIYDAVVEGKPLYERIITMTGHGINKPSNLKVRIGMNFQELIDFCGGLNSTNGKVIMGGPMMGIGQYNMESPVIKPLGGLLFLNDEESKKQPITACIKCGKCVEVCPISLLPVNLHILSMREKFEEAKKLNIMSCIECGSCSYICPSKRPILEYIRLGKYMIKSNKKNK